MSGALATRPPRLVPPPTLTEAEIVQAANAYSYKAVVDDCAHLPALESPTWGHVRAIRDGLRPAEWVLEQIGTNGHYCTLHLSADGRVMRDPNWIARYLQTSNPNLDINRECSALVRVPRSALPAIEMVLHSLANEQEDCWWWRHAAQPEDAFGPRRPTAAGKGPTNVPHPGPFAVLSDDLIDAVLHLCVDAWARRTSSAGAHALPEDPRTAVHRATFWRASLVCKGWRAAAQRVLDARCRALIAELDGPMMERALAAQRVLFNTALTPTYSAAAEGVLHATVRRVERWVFSLLSSRLASNHASTCTTHPLVKVAEQDERAWLRRVAHVVVLCYGVLTHRVCKTKTGEVVGYVGATRDFHKDRARRQEDVVRSLVGTHQRDGNVAESMRLNVTILEHLSMEYMTMLPVAPSGNAMREALLKLRLSKERMLQPEYFWAMQYGSCLSLATAALRATTDDVPLAAR